jgi:hypothetical protein
MINPLKLIVTFGYEIERDGWHDSPHGRLFGSYTREIELRAEVTFYGVNDEPDVELLDKAVIEDADLTAAEIEGAEECAIEAALDELRREPRDDEETLRADYLLDLAKDERLREAV